MESPSHSPTTSNDSEKWEPLMFTTKEDSWMSFFAKIGGSCKIKCLLCQKVYTGFIKQNLKRHFHAKHPMQGKDQGTAIIRRKAFDDSPDSTKKAKTGRLNRAETIRNCVYMAVFEKVPFTHFNSNSFRNLTAIHAFNNDVTINAATVRGFVVQAAAAVREKLKAEIMDLMIHLKLDVASRHFRSQLGVNVQFYSTLHKTLVVRSLGFIELLQSHTSEYLRCEVYKILDLYDINRRNICTFTCDNGANMVCLGGLIKRMQHDVFLNDSLRLMQENRIESSDEESEDEDESDVNEKMTENLVGTKFDDDSPMALLSVVRCAAHTLQLAVHDALKETAKPEISKIRSVVKSLKSSRYRRIAKLKLDVTRWNSLYTMINSMLEQREELEDLFSTLSGKDLNDVRLDESDFDLMQEFVSAFKPVSTCTQLLQSQNMAMSDLLLNWYRCERQISRINETNRFKEALRVAFAERGNKLMGNLALASAVYLDPRVHYDGSAPELLGDLVTDVEERLMKALRQLKQNKIAQTYKANQTPDLEGFSSASDDDEGFEQFVRSRTSGPVDSEEMAVKEKIVQKELQQKVRQLGAQKRISPKANIFDYYEKLLREKQIDKECYELAMVVLSAPATQVSVERSFSALALVMEAHRIRMRGELIDDILVCALNAALLHLDDFNMQ